MDRAGRPKVSASNCNKDPPTVWTVLPAVPSAAQALSYRQDSRGTYTQAWPLLQLPTELQSFHTCPVKASWSQSGQGNKAKKWWKKASLSFTIEQIRSNRGIGRLRDVPKATGNTGRSWKHTSWLGGHLLPLRAPKDWEGKDPRTAQRLSAPDFTGSCVLDHITLGRGGGSEENGHLARASVVAVVTDLSRASSFSAPAKHCYDAQEKLEQGFPRPFWSCHMDFFSLCPSGFWDRSGTGLCLVGKIPCPPTADLRRQLSVNQP